VGERRVIFAHEGTFVSPIVGFDQGALRVVAGAGGAMVVPDAPAGTTAALRLGPAASADGGAVPLEEFLARVRQQLAQPPGGTP
jgi:hypothetical protein